MNILKNPFFFSLDGVLWGLPLLPQHLLWKWFAGMCPIQGELADWHILTHSRCQAAQLSHANLSLLLHCFPTCNQGFPSCLSLCCLSARSIRWSWGCNQDCLTGKPQWKATTKRSWAGQWDGETTVLSCCQQQIVNVCKNAPLPGILIFKLDSTAWESWRPERLTKTNSLFSELFQSYSQRVHLQDYLCKCS